ncbi:hypothetical protein D3C87_952620 [compost metagenome]
MTNINQLVFIGDIVADITLAGTTNHIKFDVNDHRLAPFTYAEMTEISDTGFTIEFNHVGRGVQITNKTSAVQSQAVFKASVTYGLKITSTTIYSARMSASMTLKVDHKGTQSAIVRVKLDAIADAILSSADVMIRKARTPSSTSGEFTSINARESTKIRKEKAIAGQKAITRVVELEAELARLKESNPVTIDISAVRPTRSNSTETILNKMLKDNSLLSVSYKHPYLGSATITIAELEAASLKVA